MCLKCHREVTRGVFRSFDMSVLSHTIIGLHPVALRLRDGGLLQFAHGHLCIPSGRGTLAPCTRTFICTFGMGKPCTSYTVIFMYLRDGETLHFIHGHFYVPSGCRPITFFVAIPLYIPMGSVMSKILRLTTATAIVLIYANHWF